jgi:hypothetical protein
VARLDRRCRPTALVTWHLPLTPDAAAALGPWLATGEARLGDLLRSPAGRDEQIAAVALMVVRGGLDVLTPGDDFVLAPGDVLFFAGHAGAQQDLETVLVDESTREYVLHDREIPSSWVWRKLSPARR